MSAADDAFRAAQAKIAEVKAAGRAEVSEGTDANAQAPEARGVMASTREIARALAERGLEDQRKQQTRNRKLARQGDELVDGVVRGPLGLPLHVMKRLEQPLRALAMRFPKGMGWDGSVYDHVFGPEDQR